MLIAYTPYRDTIASNLLIDLTDMPETQIRKHIEAQVIDDWGENKKGKDQPSPT